MRKIVLMPDSLEYRELSPFTLDEFSELFEAYGDVEDAYQSFLEQNDFYELCDIDEQFETYEVVVTSGDPIYTFDNVAMPKVSSGVVSLVKQLPKEKPLKIEKCLHSGGSVRRREAEARDRAAGTAACGFLACPSP